MVFQLLDALAEPLGLNTTIQRSILVIVGVGFFVALVLAWYHGEKGRQRVSGPELLMVAAMLVIVGGVLSVLRPEEEATQASQALVPFREGDDRPSMAVLPCANMSPDPGDEYLAEGIQRLRFALNLDPLYQTIHLNVGDVVFLAGRHQEAIEHLEESLALFPEFNPVREALGRMYTQVECTRRSAGIRKPLP